MQFDPTRRYRMPVFFGPSPGPRQDAVGGRFDYASSPREHATVSFLTDAARLEALLPPGFSLDGDPVVTFEHFALTDIPWLAGRGYDALGMRFPARFKGQVDDVRGPLLTVLWENFADAILTGRDELGYSKLFADLPPPEVGEGSRLYRASWGGHEFLKMELSGLSASPPPTLAAVDGVLHYRYFPRVNAVGQADAAYPTLTPAVGKTETVEFYRGQGEVTLNRATWEQMPTQSHIVNILADLPVLESRGATFAVQRGAKDLSDVRILS